MSFTKKKAEVAVLAVLSVILAAVLYVQFLLVPLMTECAELEERISKEQFSLSMAKNDILSAERLSVENAALREKISNQRELLSPFMTPEELDCRMMAHFISAGLSVLSLDISSAAYTDTDINVHTAEYTAAGTYSALLELISCINNEDGMVIDSISISSDNAAGRAASTQKLVFSVSLSLYMEGV